MSDKAEKIVLGKCKCPLCPAVTAEVREDKNARAYIHCDTCVSVCRSMSRAGESAMRAMIIGTQNAPAPVPAPVAPKETPKPAAPKVRAGMSAAEILTGGR